MSVKKNGMYPCFSLNLPEELCDRLKAFHLQAINLSSDEHKTARSDAGKVWGKEKVTS
jgi:hypothetical protein